MQGRLIAETSPSGELKKEYLYLGDIPVAGSNDRRLAQGRDHVDPGDECASAQDAAVDDSSVASGLGAFTCNLRFPGQYFDQETGTHYNYFRDYDPLLGRYLQSDPIGLEGGLSSYAYVAADPLGSSDPTGELPVHPGALPQSFVDGAAGLGDAFLIPEWLRDWWGIGSVDKCSPSYGVGKGAGFAIGLGPFALRGLAGLSYTYTFRFLNQNRHLRFGPGQMKPAGPGLPGGYVARVSIGKGPGNRHFDLRTRIPPPPPVGGASCECPR